MFTYQKKQEFYEALVRKDAFYEGIFFAGIKTTGIFCRPTCGARKPKFENCLFFQTAEEALLASFRPCLKCKPLSLPDEAASFIKTLIDAVEKNPEKRWKDIDFKNLGIDVSTARRGFKKRFGMTFVQYARSRRMGMALKSIRQGSSIIEAQLDAGYDSSSGFRDAFSKMMGAPPLGLNKSYHILKASMIDTPLGVMIGIADDKGLYLLEFVNRRGLEREIERLRLKMRAAIIPGTTDPLLFLEKELSAYFKGELKHFKTPLHFLGSDFQKDVWNALINIPYGETQSYSHQAQVLKKPLAYRAVANANGMNQIAIVIPCHRVIKNDGSLGGYGGGIQRKRWLIDHERKYK